MASLRIEAAVVTSPGAAFSIQSLALDAPRADEVLVRIVAVGLCHTDLVARDALMPIPLPAVLGHEGSGIVERVGSAVTKVAPGDAVVLTFRSCGACARCAAGDPAYCDQGFALNYTGVRTDGSRTISGGPGELSGNFFGQSSFASHAIGYERNVVKVPADAPLALLGPLACGVQTGAGAVLRALACPAGSAILITGGGSVGLSAAMAAVVAGCTTIIVSDPLAARRALALELGATHVVDPGATDLLASVREIRAEGCDFALDTTGAPAVVDAALACLRARGTLGLVGIPTRMDAPSPGSAMGLLGRGHTVRGIIEGDSNPDSFIPELIALYQAGRFPFDRLITTYPFAEINRAVADQQAGLCAKPVLLMPA